MIGGTGRNKEIFRIKKGPEANQLNDSSFRALPGGVWGRSPLASLPTRFNRNGFLGVPRHARTRCSRRVADLCPGRDADPFYGMFCQALVLDGYIGTNLQIFIKRRPER